MPLFITITDANSRSTRAKYDTDDPAAAIGQAVAANPLELKGDAAVLCVVVERKAKLTKADIAEQIEIIRTVETERAQ